MDVKNKKLVVIIGPTAVGKTLLAVQLAKFLQTEIVSADARQFYRETDVGTAKPEPQLLEEVKHHFINTLSIEENYTAGQFERDALRVLSDILKKNDWAVMVGGSGLYVQAVCHGLDEMPEIKPGIREKWNALVEQDGLETVRIFVRQHDPDFYEVVDRGNPARLIRAAEVIESTGRAFSSFRTQAAEKVERPFSVIKIGLTDERESLYRRIDERMDQMITNGLFEEAESLFPRRHLQALQTVGYQEIFGFIEGKYDKEEAVRLLKRNSRRYAKRQLTWFRKDSEIRWFNRGEEQVIFDYLRTEVQES